MDSKFGYLLPNKPSVKLFAKRGAYSAFQLLSIVATFALSFFIIESLGSALGKENRGISTCGAFFMTGLVLFKYILPASEYYVKRQSHYAANNINLLFQSGRIENKNEGCDEIKIMRAGRNFC